MTTNLPEESSPEQTPEGEVPKPVEPTHTLTPEIIAPPSEPAKPQVAVFEPPRQPWVPAFYGEGSKYFVIQLVNAILRVITLNFYYPWAKAEKLRYLYEQTEFANSRFTFHGSGKEMFIGYLKAFSVAAILFGGYFFLTHNKQIILAFLLLYGGIILLYPVAIHGTIKYRLSRTSWRGIFFGYHGELGELFAKFFIGGLLSLFTLTIYWSWVQVDLRKYVSQNVRFGNVEFEFTGTGLDLFLIKLKYMAFFFVGYILAIVLLIVIGGASLLTLSASIKDLDGSIFVVLGMIYLMLLIIFGVIGLMRQREIFQFYVDKTKIWQNEQWHAVRLHMTFAELFKLSFTNMLLLIFTLGIATPYVEIRNLHFIMPRLAIAGTFEPNDLIQTESDYRDATGEDVGDWLDIDLV